MRRRRRKIDSDLLARVHLSMQEQRERREQAATTAFCMHDFSEHDVYGQVCVKCGDHRSIPIANT